MREDMGMKVRVKFQVQTVMKFQGWEDTPSFSHFTGNRTETPVRHASKQDLDLLTQWASPTFTFYLYLWFQLNMTSKVASFIHPTNTVEHSILRARHSARIVHWLKNKLQSLPSQSFLQSLGERQLHRKLQYRMTHRNDCPEKVNPTCIKHLDLTLHV